MPRPTRRAYDHRIRQQIALTGNPKLFPELAIPRSTTQTWIRRGARDVVALAEDGTEEAKLRTRLAILEHRTAVLQAIVTLLLALLRISGFKLGEQRLPEGDRKRAILDAVSRAQRNLDLKSALRILHLSPARYHLGTREVVHVAVTRSPSSQRTAQQLWNATPFGNGPCFIIRDRDHKFGAEFDHTSAGFITATEGSRERSHCSTPSRS